MKVACPPFDEESYLSDMWFPKEMASKIVEVKDVIAGWNVFKDWEQKNEIKKTIKTLLGQNKEYELVQSICLPKLTIANAGRLINFLLEKDQENFPHDLLKKYNSLISRIEFFKIYMTYVYTNTTI